MSEHDNDTCPHLVRASLLEAENTRLKAEVERWKGNHAVVIEDRNTVLSSLVNMKAEVERLREAGDALAAWTLTLEHTYDHKPMDGLPFSSFLCVWHDAAKEGKPSV